MDAIKEIQKIAITATISIKHLANIDIADSSLKSSLISKFDSAGKINGVATITIEKKYFVLS